jgi:uncharacterized membrane protein (UPF0127 family)
MNDGIMILFGIGFLFVLGTTCLILDMIYNKDSEVVYVKKATKPKTQVHLEDDDDLVINDDVSQSNFFQE